MLELDVLKLKKNKKLKTVLKLVSNSHVDEEQLGATVYDRFCSGKLGHSAFLNVAGKVHVRETLEQIAKKVHGVIPLINSQGGQYNIVQDPFDGIAARDSDGKFVAQYDKILSIDGLIVGFEVCLASRPRNREVEIPKRIDYALNLKRIRQQIAPLKALGPNVAYVIILYEHQVNRQLIVHSNFARRGGVIGSFGLNYGQFCSKLGEVMSTYGMPINRIRDLDSGEFRVG